MWYERGRLDLRRTPVSAHARCADALAIAAYVWSSDVLDQALADFAELYGDQNELDYAALTAAVNTGRVKAQTVLWRAPATRCSSPD